MKIETSLGPVEIRTLLDEDDPELLWFEAAAGMKRHIARFPQLRLNGVPYVVVISGIVTPEGVVILNYARLRRGGKTTGFSTQARALARRVIGAAVGRWSTTDEAQSAWEQPEKPEKERTDG